MAGRLSVVATPIGNLEDITLRAVRTLRECDGVLAEDTRRTRGLLAHLGLDKPVRALHAHSPQAHVDRWLDALAGGAHFALVTDAGTPLVSDPGQAMVRGARERGIAVETVPGPSALTAALAVAGVVAPAFRFVGFLPRKGRKREERIAAIARDDDATVLFESPERLGRTLGDLVAAGAGQREGAVCRELTKLHEEVVRGPLDALAARYSDAPARGEITLVVGARDVAREASEDELEARAELARTLAREMAEEGHSTKDIAKALEDELGLAHRDAYALALVARGD
ncbi:MAG: 16S rRNA (cytidine(1402)-2'-O)-methyltransferase [Deltaproteobacteria bacterium]|nr:16S rRNA (cytidine(1402)-2'-O)-methyltransferase [Deltaproteobacteria bacterium]